jgi:hypothetical protein
MNNTLQDLMREATRLTRAGRLREAVEAIRRALSSASESNPTNAYGDSAGFRESGPVTPEVSPLVLDAGLLGLQVISLQ